MTQTRYTSDMAHQSEAASAVKPTLSFAIPVYGCPAALPELCDRIDRVCRTASLSYEIVLVDDRCPYDSWSVIKRICEERKSVVGVRLSRNFGQHAAIQAALRFVSGEWIVVMDCDLQDQPEDIPLLLAKAHEGWQIVQARRGKRLDDYWWRRQCSKLFYRMLGFLTETDQDAEVANFGLYNKRVVAAILSWNEETKYFPAIVQWVGFSRTSVQVTHAGRHSGASSYDLKKLLRLAANVVVGFSDKPLRLLVMAGLSISATSFFVSTAVFILHLFGRIVIEGWASLALSLWFIAGWLTFALGLTGLYVGRILVEAKARPTYILDETLRLSVDAEAVAKPAMINHLECHVAKIVCQ